MRQKKQKGGFLSILLGTLGATLLGNLLARKRIVEAGSGNKLKKLKTVVKYKAGTTLRMSLKMFDENDLPHQLLLTTRHRTKLTNAFNNDISTDLKLSRAQISKIISKIICSCF